MKYVKYGALMDFEVLSLDKIQSFVRMPTGADLTALINRLGCTREEFATMLGISRTTLYRLERMKKKTINGMEGMAINQIAFICNSIESEYLQKMKITPTK